MDGISTLRASVILFALAASGGLLMAFIRFTRTVNPPPWLSMLHGLLAAAGLTLLIVAVCAYTMPFSAKLALALLLIAVVGGVVMNLNYQWQRRLIPAAILWGHASLAVVAFCILAYEAYLR